MRLRTLVIALALTLAGGLALPGQADARPRHSRHGVVDRGHHRETGWRGSYGYYAPYRSYRYDRYYEPYYESYYEPDYGPYYEPYRYRSYRRGHVHFRGRVRLPHLSIHIGR